MIHQQIRQRDYILTGTITKVVSHDSKTGYTILQVLRSKTPKRVEHVIAHLPAAYAGINMQFQGEWHFQNGKPIFYADFSYELQPKTLTEIRKYLKSGILQGAGNPVIKNIVRHFKEQTLLVLNDPKVITMFSEVDGVSKTKISRIMGGWYEHKIRIDIMHFLQGHGLTCSYAVQAYNFYGGFTKGKIQENPYRLLQDMQDISFPDVDSVALSIGIAPDHQERIFAAVLHLLSDCQNYGHCYLTGTQIHKSMKRLLHLDLSKILPEHLRYMEELELVKSRVLTPKGRLPQLCYYEASIFDAELYVARKISRNNIPPEEVDLEWLKDLVKQYQVSNLALNDEQADAAIGSVCSKYSVLTGGPGTGKSATLKAIAYILKKMALTFNLVAPTNRSAHRLSVVTGENAQTIHSLLGCKAENLFQYDEKIRFDTDFLILEESSMVDIRLLAALLHAAPGNAQVLFVGDPDQLPARRAGDVLRDIIDSKVLSVYELTQPFCQSEDSMIIRFANQLKMGLSAKLLYSEIERVKSDDMDTDCFFFFSEMRKYGLWEDAICNFVNHCPYPLDFDAFIHPPNESKSNLDQKEFTTDFIRVLYQELNSSQDAPEIQILTPTGQTSWSLNRNIQDTVNPYYQGKRQLRIGNNIFRVGDRVIHCKNNYKLEVFNGEVGTILQIGDKGTGCTVVYPGERLVYYSHDDIRELDLAYALPINKSQGAEFDVVIIPLLERGLLRHMLYTAITRAKKLAVLVGAEAVFTKALKNRYQLWRQTGLKEQLLS